MKMNVRTEERMREPEMRDEKVQETVKEDRKEKVQ